MSLVGCTFPGISQVRSARYTRSLGVFPDVAILEVIPQPNTIQANGTLTFFGPNGFVSIRNCRVDSAALRLTMQGHVLDIRILDRRWAWFGAISGRYNALNPDGTLDLATERTPQQLAALLFQAMGEFSFDVSALPSDSRPFKFWECADAKLELDELCSALGCRVSLGLDDVPRIVRVGFGADLPTVDAQSVGFSINPADKPRSLLFCGGATVFQSRLKLQAVGQEADGSIVPIDELSYKPTGGWEATTCDGGSTDFPEVTAGESERSLAIRTVFKMFRVVSQADGSQNVPGTGNVDSIDRLLPLRRNLIQNINNFNDQIVPLAAFVTGKMTVGGDPPSEEETELDTIVDDGGGFTLYENTGVVWFNRIMVRRVGGETKPAELYLTAAYNVRRGPTEDRVRLSITRQIGGAAGVMPVRQFAIFETHRALYSTNSTTVSGVATNTLTVQAEANIILDAVQQQFSDAIGGMVQCRGILPISTDGAIQQVSWGVQCDGPNRGARTWASRMTEVDPGVPRWREKSRVRATLQAEVRGQREPVDVSGRDRLGSAEALL